ncbi:AMP-binding protein [Marinibaculum pumilum]|uniref:AMP-binding protein n=1 Tax=Marinibaculum pumilum TaxID=1766165 RepID=A0ABV7L4Q5_9PROT
MNLANLLVRAGRSFGDRPALLRGEAVLADYAGLAGRVARLAGGLLGHGLARGDRIALIMKNRADYVELLFACWQAGLVAVPVNAKLHPREFAHILADSGARAAFVSPDLETAVTEAAALAPELAWIETAGGHGHDRMAHADPIAPAAVAADDIAWLFYTSGTTGRPKGAMLSHRNLMAMSLSYFADVDTIGPGDCIIHAAPMSHGSGLYILPHVAAAASQVVPESGGFDPAELLRLFGRLRGATLFAAPTMVTRLLAHPGLGYADPAGLKTIVYGGGPMYLEDCRRAIDAFGPHRLVQIYGQGESPMTITVAGKPVFADAGHPRRDARLASVGIAFAGLDVMVADGVDRPLPAGETGEILVRGDTVMRGYWNNPAATADALRDGWLHTGDLGAFDEDGFLTLKDRSKDMIISGGTNIYPREVEEALLHDPRLAEVAVVGRPHADWGEEVVAFVVAREGEAVTAAELDTLCQARIARFKRPKDYRFVDALPKNNYGKVLKTELRAVLAD